MKAFKKIFTKDYIVRKWRRMLERLHLREPNLEFWQAVDQLYYDRTGKKMNYKNPQDINEKLMWLSRYWQNPLISQCADKYRMREYVKSCGLEDLLVPIYGVWQKADDIPFDELPDKFVLKCNHGSGYNIVCTNKEDLNKQQTVQQLNEWLKIDYGKVTLEPHYSIIPPVVYCEKFLPFKKKQPADFKFHCINGEPYFIQVTDFTTSTLVTSNSSFSMKWEQLFNFKNEEIKNINKPIQLDYMVKYAKILSSAFPYVRVDFLEVDGNLYIGELTFTPHGRVLDYLKDDVIKNMGELLILPPKYKTI